MTREFLKNIKVGDSALPKEIIDAIMEENGNDIENAKKPFTDYDTIKEQLAEAQKTIQGFKDQGQDIEAVRTKATEWEQKYNQAIADHNKAMADRDFTDRLTAAINTAKGKNSKAIAALLDTDTLKASKNQEADIKSALDALQKDNAYLFGEDTTPPPYAPGAGSQSMGGTVSGVEAAFAKLNPDLKID